MITEVELRCEVATWVRPAILALALLARIGIPLDYEALACRLVARGAKPIAKRVPS